MSSQFVPRITPAEALRFSGQSGDFLDTGYTAREVAEFCEAYFSAMRTATPASGTSAPCKRCSPLAGFRAFGKSAAVGREQKAAQFPQQNGERTH